MKDNNPESVKIRENQITKLANENQSKKISFNY